MKKAIILLSLFAVQVSLFAQEYFPEGTRWKGSAVEVAIDGVNYFLNLNYLRFLADSNHRRLVPSCIRILHHNSVMYNQRDVGMSPLQP